MAREVAKNGFDLNQHLSPRTLVAPNLSPLDDYIGDLVSLLVLPR